MKQIPRSVIDNYTRMLNTISDECRAVLADALERIDYSQDVATIRQQVAMVMEGVCGMATDTAAEVAATFYDGLREMELGSKMGAIAESGRIPEATEGAVMAFAEYLVDGNVDSFVNACLSRLDYEVKVAASQTCLNNAKRDTRKPRFARVPSGSDTCPFCLMLASRGFVYHTDASASHAHDNCDCRVTPSWKAHAVEGYDPDELYDRWKHPEKYESEETQPQEQPAQRQQPMTERQRLEAEAREAYIENGGGMGLTPEQAAERFDLLVDGNTDAQLRQYIRRHGKK